MPKLSVADRTRLTDIEPAISRENLDQIEFEVADAPLGFFRWAKAAAVTWPLNSVVYVNPNGRAKESGSIQLAVLAHESAHVGQRRRLGRLGFLLAYLALAVLTIGRKAGKHPMEREGHRIERAVRVALDGD